MQLQFKNEHIYFSVDDIWERLHYRYRNELYPAVRANSDEDFIQTIEVPEDILIEIFKTVTVYPEGVASSINQEMLSSLVGQLEAESNLAAVQEGTEEPNEAARILIAIEDIDKYNKSVKAAKIASGKNKILS